MERITVELSGGIALELVPGDPPGWELASPMPAAGDEDDQGQVDAAHESAESAIRALGEARELARDYHPTPGHGPPFQLHALAVARAVGGVARLPEAPPAPEGVVY